MSNTPITNSHQEEIDLGYLMNKINDLFKKGVKLLFEIISFFLKFKLITVSILVFLIIYGYYTDKASVRVFENKVILIPNFESVDYLYNQAQSLNQKRNSHDTIFLNRIFSENHKHFKGVEIEPFVDIYDFVSSSRENVEIFKVFAQNNDISEYIQDLTNSKYYKYHLLTFKSSGKANSDEIKDSIISYLNSNIHFNDYKNIFQDNTAFSIQENQNMIHQIDSIIAASYKLSLKSMPNQSVFMNDNSNLNGLIHTKKMLIEERLTLLMRQNDERSIIKEVSSTFNLTKHEGFVIPYTIKYPLFYLIIFSGLFIIYKSFVNLKKIAESN